MDIFVLAAGKGSRLLPLTKNTPKCLIEISDGTTLLEAQLQNIDCCKVDRVFLITGYLSEQIEAKLQSYEKEYDLDIQIIFNPFYGVSNNFMSLWMAYPYLTEDFIIVNGDVVFHTSVLEKLLETSEEVCMVIDKKPEYDDEDMKVRIKGDCISHVSKKIPIEEGDGESIGMIRFQGSGVEHFKREMAKLARTEEGMNVFWLRAIQNLIDTGFCVRYLEIPIDQWAEIDFHPDLQAVQERVFKYIPDSLVKKKD